MKTTKEIVTDIENDIEKEKEALAKSYLKRKMQLCKDTEAQVKRTADRYILECDNLHKIEEECKKAKELSTEELAQLERERREKSINGGILRTNYNSIEI